MKNVSVENYPQALKFVPDCFKTQKMFNKAVGIYPSSMQFFSECYKTQGMCHKTVDTSPFIFASAPDW